MNKTALSILLWVIISSTAYAATLADSIQNQTGVQSQISSASSGKRRILINGQRGEYTTVMLDGIPLYSTPSSYYALDALSLAGVSEVQIMRGTGASLLAPEAFGGVINLITQPAVQNSAQYDLSIGNQDYRSLSLVGTGVSSTQTRRATIAAQYNQQGAWDVDRNQITESPRRRNASLFTRISNDFSENDHFEIRGSFLDGAVLGGTTLDSVSMSMVDPSHSWKTESIQIRRFELTERWSHRFASGLNSVVTGGTARQTQDSFYGGRDYSNRDQVTFVDWNLGKTLASEHQILVGFNYKGEHLRSESYQYFTVAGVDRDDFDQIALGGYLQDVWMISDRLELTGAVRVDRLMVNWLGKKTQKYELEQWGVAPKLGLRWTHGRPTLVSQVTLAQGYRAPMAFYEFDPAFMNRGGWDIRTTVLEKSDSATYGLSWKQDQITAGWTANWTRIHQMASINTRDFSRPALVSDPGQVSVKSTDVVLGYAWTPEFQTTASYEKYFYDPGYRAVLPVIPIEDRAKLDLNYDWGGWGATATAIWVGARKLRSVPPRRTEAPSYETLDLKLSKTMRKSAEVKLYIGVRNLFNTLQIAKESPLYYSANGTFNQDQIWGPLRGREYYAGIQGKF